MITFEPKANAVLADVCAEVALLAKLNGESVRFIFGNQPYVAKPGDTAAQLERALGGKPSIPYRQPYAD